MAAPSMATENVAHAVVGVAVAIVVAKVVRKGGIGAAVASGLIAALLHKVLDSPVAKVMADHGIQL
jgi:hypothetical protein